MKRDEAETIFGMIAAVYDLHPERSGQQAVVWVPALEDLDAEVVMKIVDGWMKGKGPEKMPTLPMFQQEVRAATAKPERHWDALADCTVCDDDGQVEVPDGMAPCPACPAGKLLEFPLDGEGAWGPNGFWRGKKWVAVGAGAVEIQVD